MARSLAFQDFQERFTGMVPLLRAALCADAPLLATAAAKGAIVLAAAASERYMNDALREACQRMQVKKYEDLSEGHQAYLCTQIARKIALYDRDDGDIRIFSAERRVRFRKVVEESGHAFEDPSSWQYVADFGLFMDGAAAPEKINAVIRDFDPRRGDFFDCLDGRVAGRAQFIRALVELVDARHNAAHAKPGTNPSPSDARGWIVSVYWLIRAVENHLAVLSAY